MSFNGTLKELQRGPLKELFDMAAGWRSARLRVWAARVMCVALFCGHFGSCFLLPAACRPPLPSGLSTLASFQSLARKQQRIACARPLPAAARKRYGGLGNAKASLDFDSIRTSLRGAMQLAAAAGSIAVVVQALSSSVQKSGSAQSTLDLGAVQRFYNSLTAAELQQLFWCIFLDTAGAAPELLLPGPLGESVDFFWAPVYAFLLFQT